MIEIHLLEVLDAFAKEGTLSKAAEVLLTSQPALTRSMKKLEDELGVSLFNRTKNHMSLNETGKVAAEYAQHVLREDRLFEERVKAYDLSLRTLSIGYCAPIPQTIMTPIINNLFAGMTISADMKEDSSFIPKLYDHSYQLAVTHEEPQDQNLYCKKCGHEELYISVKPSDPLSFYPEVHLSDLDGKSVLLLSNIGFWMELVHKQTPNAHYLIQIDNSSFVELLNHSDYPCFSSSYYLRRNEVNEGRINIPIADASSKTDYYLVCLKSQYKKFKKLFDAVTDKTIT